ncbi:MAG: glycosyltransferase family 4 protein [Desulfobacteraceae bacterium]|nr:glycosyltransferase family 4 protein [Desulfobacteraceae bacterium]
MESAGKSKRVLIIVENLPVPFDRRVWQEATTLGKAGYTVSVISPVGKGFDKLYEEIDGIAVYRHPLATEANGAGGYAREYSSALFQEFVLSRKVLAERGFDVIQACNPPDTIFLIGLFYKVFFGKKFIFDHHDINPELYLAKFGRKDLFYMLVRTLEKLTFLTADLSIATNMSYRQVAIGRGGMRPDKVAVVRSGPSLERLQPVASNPRWKQGKAFLVGYVGVMGKQEGIDHLLRAAHYIVRELGREDIHFLLIGSGTEFQSLVAMNQDLGLSKYVTFTGRVSDDQMIEALCTSDVCVNPDVANEMNDKSTMNKVMEYMALGKPIVQYDLTEGRFSAREASLYAERNNTRDLADKILYLLAHPEERARMGAFGFNRVRSELHWGIEAPKYLGLYEKLFRYA